jgi:hypothetical protein
MAFVAGLAHTPLEALSPSYWVILFAFPALYLIIVLFPSPETFETFIRSMVKDGKINFALHTLGGSLLLLNAFFNNVQHPDWGGLNAFLFVLSSTWLVSTFVLYRRNRLLNRQ